MKNVTLEDHSVELKEGISDTDPQKVLISMKDLTLATKSKNNLDLQVFLKQSFTICFRSLTQTNSKFKKNFMSSTL